MRTWGRSIDGGSMTHTNLTRTLREYDVLFFYFFSIRHFRKIVMVPKVQIDAGRAIWAAIVGMSSTSEILSVYTS